MNESDDIQHNMFSFRSFSEDIEALVTVPLQRRNRDKVIYLKTYKTASSTLASIFHNYAIRRNKSLIIAKPSQLWNFTSLSQREKILKMNTLNNDKSHREIFANHAVYHPFLHKLISNTSNQIVTILRDPTTRFLSSWNHEWGSQYYLQMFAPYITSLATLIQNASIDPQTKFIATYKMPNMAIQLNCQCLQFGLMENWTELSNMSMVSPVKNKGLLYAHIDNIVSGEWLILITERWLESLLLLKYAYDLKWIDLIYLHNMNTNRKHKPGGDDIMSDLSDEDVDKLYKLNQCDYMIWKYANLVLDYRLKQLYQGNRTLIQIDIETLESVRKNAIRKCRDLDGKQLTPLLCKSMELDFTDWVRWARELDYIHQI